MMCSGPFFLTPNHEDILTLNKLFTCYKGEWIYFPQAITTHQAQNLRNTAYGPFQAVPFTIKLLKLLGLRYTDFTKRESSAMLLHNLNELQLHKLHKITVK